MFLNLNRNEEMEILILLEDKYSLNSVHYHKHDGKKVKCGKLIGEYCHLCDTHGNPQFLSIIPVYIRQTQEIKMLFLNKQELDWLTKYLDLLVSSDFLESNYKNIRQHIFKVKKNQQGFVHFEYLRAHNYKKLNLQSNFNVHEFIKKTYVSYDGFNKIDGDLALRKLKLRAEFED